MNRRTMWRACARRIGAISFALAIFQLLPAMPATAGDWPWCHRDRYALVPVAPAPATRVVVIVQGSASGAATAATEQRPAAQTPTAPARKEAEAPATTAVQAKVVTVPARTVYVIREATPVTTVRVIQRQTYELVPVAPKHHLHHQRAVVVGY